MTVEADLQERTLAAVVLNDASTVLRTAWQ